MIIISPNAIGELTGGGIYLRGIVQSLLSLARKRGDKLTIICKSDDSLSNCDPDANYLLLKKHKFADICARILGSPTFLLYYARTILRESKGADVILLHNSRSGKVLSWLLVRGVNCKVIVIADNVEYELVSDAMSRRSGVSRLVLFLERFLIKKAEKQSTHKSNCMSFITAADRSRFTKLYGDLPESYILPVTIPGDGCRPTSRVDLFVRDFPLVLFTGAFNFLPNVEAIRIFDWIAGEIQSLVDSDVIFTAAGKDLSKLRGLKNITLFSDPSPEDMEKLFRKARLYLAPVTWGSGMKTKVAEALSYSCPVLCLPNAAIGYEEIAYSGGGATCLAVANDPASLMDMTVQWLNDEAIIGRRQTAKAMYDQHLSNHALTKKISEMIYSEANRN